MVFGGHHVVGDDDCWKGETAEDEEAADHHQTAPRVSGEHFVGVVVREDVQVGVGRVVEVRRRLGRRLDAVRGARGACPVGRRDAAQILDLAQEILDAVPHRGAGRRLRSRRTLTQQAFGRVRRLPRELCPVRAERTQFRADKRDTGTILSFF